MRQVKHCYKGVNLWKIKIASINKENKVDHKDREKSI